MWILRFCLICAAAPFVAVWILFRALCGQQVEVEQPESEYPVLEIHGDHVWRREFTPWERAERLRERMAKAGEFRTLRHG